MKKLFNVLDLCNIQTRLRIWVVLLFLLWLCGASVLYENYRHNVWQDAEISRLTHTDKALKAQITVLETQCQIVSKTLADPNQKQTSATQ